MDTLMKQTIKNSLKRLTTGFISSVMMLSFVLMPIPRIGNVYAEDPVDCVDDTEREGGTYQPGCEWDAALSSTSFNSSARFADGEKVLGVIPKGFIEQYVVGLSGVVLINSLNYKRLHNYKPQTYGNDCPESFGAKYAIPASMVAALAYMIGDLQSNWKFKAASKKAADVNFQNVQKRYQTGEESAEGDLVEDMAQTSEQVKAFDTLEEVMKAQKSALKTKIGFTLGSQIGYAVADGIELANIGFMGAVCTQRWTRFASTKTMSVRSLSTASAAIASAIAGSVGTAATICGDVSLSMGLKGSANAVQVAKQAALSAVKTMEDTKESTETISYMARLFEVMAAWQGNKLFEQIDEMKKGLDAKEKIAKSKEVKEEIKEGQKQAEVVTKGTTKASTDAVTNISATKCVGAGELVKDYYADLDKDFYDRFECCGGDGITLSTKAAMEAAELSDANLLKKAKLEASRTIVGRLIQKAKEAALNSIGSFSKLFVKEKSKVPGGTYFIQKVPGPPGIAAFKKDIKVLSLFDTSTASMNNKQYKNKLDEGRFFLENMFEANLRRHVAKSFMIDKNDYVKSLIRFQNNEKNITKVMQEYKHFLDIEFLNIMENQDINTNTLAFKKLYKSIVNNILIPEANAGGLVATLVGAGISFGASKIDGPWSSVLNMTGKLVTLHGVIGKMMKNFGLTMPATRAITWTTLALFSRMSWRMAKDSKDQVEKNLEVLRNERDKFKNSAVNDNAMENGISGGSALNLVSVDYDTMLPTGSDTVCAKPSASGYAPRACDGKLISNNRFLNGGSGLTVRNASNLDHLGAFNNVLDLTSRGANGLVQGTEFSESALTGFQNTYNALAKKNKKLREEVDKQNSKIKGVGESGKLSLQKRVENIRKSLLNNAGGTMQNPFAAPNVAKNTEKKDDKKKDSAVTGVPAVVGSIPTPGGGNDFDFGSGDDSLLDDLSSEGEAVSMSDFELKHDDINKKKDVSIFKLLSNRYLLTYPKFMKEKK
jgi:hypothetical protein